MMINKEEYLDLITQKELNQLNNLTIEYILKDKIDPEYLNIKPCMFNHMHSKQCTI